jgi:hypothetical protein
MAATNDPRSDRRSGPRARRLRVGDNEREAVPEILRQAPLAVIAAIAATRGHLVWLALPLLFLFVVRPFVWRSSGRGRWACGPRRRVVRDPG